MTDPTHVQVRLATADDWPDVLQLRHLCYPHTLDAEDLKRRFFHNPRFGFSEDVWVAEVDGRIVANLVAIPFEVFAPGGRVIPMRGIASVAVSPLFRRKGVAGAFLRSVLQTFQEHGVPFSCLFPFEYAFYSRYGWATAANATCYEVPPASLPVFSERDQVRILSLEDLETVAECRERHFHKLGNWANRRSLAFWKQQWVNRQWQGFGYPKTGPLEGFALFCFEPLPDNPLVQDLWIDDWVADTPEALRGLLGTLSVMQEQIRAIRLSLPSKQPFSLFWLEQRAQDRPKLRGGDAWVGHATASLMGRIVSLPEALQARSYGMEDGALGIRCVDGELPRNHQAVTLQIENGVGQVASGLPAEWIETDVGTLTQLWMGALSARHAAAWGKVRASGDAAIQLADRLFATAHEPFWPEVDSF